jgi:uncharacterized SAM-binding protein YcdF (DUF218 family)
MFNCLYNLLVTDIVNKILKTSAHLLINPYHQLFLLLILLLFFLFLKKYRLSRKVAITMILWWVSILLPVYEQLIYEEERHWIPLQMDKKMESPDHILVLGGGKVSDPLLPQTAQLTSPQLYRLTEGIRIYKNRQAACFITSGWGNESKHSTAGTVAGAALMLGVHASDTLRLDTPKNTQQETEALMQRLPQLDSIILVTSAMHMRRAKAWMEHAGFHVLPAPTDYLIKRDPSIKKGWRLSIHSRMQYAYAFWYEWAGRWHGRMQGLSI